jgi:hypothetical protein
MDTPEVPEARGGRDGAFWAEAFSEKFAGCLVDSISSETLEAWFEAAHESGYELRRDLEWE